MKRLNRKLLISCALSFVSFFIRAPRIDDAKIRGVYLFGSVARGDFNENSDIDIFIDSPDKFMSAEAKKTVQKFYASEDFKKFSLLGVSNDINVLSGNINDWELKDSVAENGILLYGRTIPDNAQSFFLVNFEPIKKSAVRNKLIRSLFGRHEKYSKGEGLVKKNEGFKKGERCFLIPTNKSQEVLQEFAKNKVSFTLEKLWKKD
ncbi:nucleotidyltransferase domain-containing protein [Candidatus Woesearchaeota archaeon]|nr:nucleotidyltransferase domain-containing protein [Candidatus Woesearchaeota archaeon]